MEEEDSLDNIAGEDTGDRASEVDTAGSDRLDSVADTESTEDVGHARQWCRAGTGGTDDSEMSSMQLGEAVG